MAASREFTLDFTPRHRFDLFDVNAALRAHEGDVLGGFARALYVSYHTTAGFLDATQCAALTATTSASEMPLSSDAVRRYVEQYRRLYPEGAGYRHDQLEQRSELTDEQKKTEPLNGDAHLSYIGSGLENCVTYASAPAAPAWLVDLDGVGLAGPRRRRITVTGFDRERTAARFSLDAPVSAQTVDSFNLRDARVGLVAELDARVRALGIAKGRVDVRLRDDDRSAALTVNEFETLLMQHDLADVLRNPFRHAAVRGWHALRDPAHVKDKVKDYMKYDLLVLVNDRLDRWKLRGTAVERVVNAAVRRGALHYLHMKRGLSLPISDHDRDGVGEIVQGTYQSPILVQWQPPRAATRTLDVRIVAFE